MKSKNFKDYELGFDRTQLWKEHERPIFNRQTALRCSMDLMVAHNLKWSMTDIMNVSKCLVSYLDTGNQSFVKGLDEYFKLKEDQKLSELLRDFKDIENI